MKYAAISFSFFIFILLLIGCSSTNHIDNTTALLPKNPNKGIDYSDTELKTIYFAGGCFWGVEAYFSRIYGVSSTTSGYANGTGENPAYEEVIAGDRKFVETVEVKFDPERISLAELIEYFFKVVDPTSVNNQGNDFGIQYRSGIYFIEDKDETVIQQMIDQEQEKYKEEIVTENLPLMNYYLAEEYHQDYLEKNPNGYCHIDLSILEDKTLDIDATLYPRPNDEEIKDKLTEQQYEVAMQDGTEREYSHEYWDHDESGIYVDVVTGEPLFSSRDKYDSGCGWPSFTKPISKEVVTSKHDPSYGMDRTEIKSRSGDIHLGHVFDDGPKEEGGNRFCINGAALRFVPLDDMSKEGYRYLIQEVE